MKMLPWLPAPREPGEGQSVQRRRQRRELAGQLLRVGEVVGQVAADRGREQVLVREQTPGPEVRDELRHEAADHRQNLGLHHEREAPPQPGGVVDLRAGRRASWPGPAGPMTSNTARRIFCGCSPGVWISVLDPGRRQDLVGLGGRLWRGRRRRRAERVVERVAERREGASRRLAGRRRDVAGVLDVHLRGRRLPGQERQRPAVLIQRNLPQPLRRVHIGRRKRRRPLRGRELQHDRRADEVRRPQSVLDRRAFGERAVRPLLGHDANRDLMSQIGWQ